MPPWNPSALLFQAGTTFHAPSAGKIAALPWPRRIDAAAPRGIQEFAASVRAFLQGELGAVPRQYRVRRDELIFRKRQGRCQRRDVPPLQQHRAGPAAAGSAMLADKRSHGKQAVRCGKAKPAATLLRQHASAAGADPVGILLVPQLSGSVDVAQPSQRTALLEYLIAVGPDEEADELGGRLDGRQLGTKPHLVGFL